MKETNMSPYEPIVFISALFLLCWLMLLSLIESKLSKVEIALRMLVFVFILGQIMFIMSAGYNPVVEIYKFLFMR